jgi:3-oxoacyl-[acyl-carrier protein] reductase
MSVLVFGASGALGSKILEHLSDSGNEVLGFTTNKNAQGLTFLDETGNWLREAVETKGSKSIVFAQGVNLNDSILDLGDIRKVLDINLLFVIEKLENLLKAGAIGQGSSVVILSSIWQEISRQNKLSYTVSKSAIRGLVNSLVADLSPLGIRVNAVLPGVIDTPMTRKALSAEAINRIERETPFGKLVSEDEIASVVSWLLSRESQGVLGQFIQVDNGWTNVKLLP